MTANGWRRSSRSRLISSWPIIFLSIARIRSGRSRRIWGSCGPGGVLFYAVPDKRYTFDFRRPRTPLSHVIADHDNGPESSRREHYLEWVRLVYEGSPPDEPEALRQAQRLEDEGYSIHFHVWTQADLVAMMLHCHERLASFEIEAVRSRSLENIVVLRKHGELIVEEPRAVGVAVPGVSAIGGVPGSDRRRRRDPGHGCRCRRCGPGWTRAQQRRTGQSIPMGCWAARWSRPPGRC